MKHLTDNSANVQPSGSAGSLINIKLSRTEFRRLLDLAYIGDWILNSQFEEEERIADYDKVLSLLFAHCDKAGMTRLFEVEDKQVVPSADFVEGGIHDAIMAYEDTAFFEILAEELARRDMGYPPIGSENVDELADRMDDYIDEFESNGIDKLIVEN
jgi:hypothetical protein